MKLRMLKLIHRLAPVTDVILGAVIVPCAAIMKFYRTIGPKFYPLTTRILKKMGVFPIRDHFHEPLFVDKDLKYSLDEKRELPGLTFHVEDQLALLNKLKYIDEFTYFLEEQKKVVGSSAFALENNSFVAGDAEFLFQYLRFLKPKKVIEVGCGASTKIIRAALANNRTFDGVESEHICIEPFREPFLDSFPDVLLHRDKIQDCNFEWETVLGENDFLFIDSSHTIRPQGPVLHEFLNILPRLAAGVNVHVHDIYTPFDYPNEAIRRDMYFWNEQYLLEATLGNSSRYKIVAALNLLRHDYYSVLKKVCPYMKDGGNSGSIYFKVKHESGFSRALTEGVPVLQNQAYSV